MAVYQDFAELFVKLHRHVVATGHMPICNDAPQLRQLGWLDEATGETWQADLTSLRRWLHTLGDGELRNACSNLMVTQEGRQKFAAYLLRKAQEERTTADSEPDAPTFWERLLAPTDTPS